MNRQNNVWRANVPRPCARSEQTRATPFKHFLRSLILILGVLLVSNLVVSCDSQQPKYEVYPTLSMEDRLKEGNNQFKWWMTRFNSELAMMTANEWKPSIDLLNTTFSQAAEEYGIPSNGPKSALLKSVKEAFYDKFKLEENDPNHNGVRNAVNGMLRFIDYEHPNLLVKASHLKPAPAIDHYRLPSMVSNDYPVGVALTKWTMPPTAESKRGGTDIIIIADAVVTPSEPSLIFAPDRKSLVSLQGAAKDDTKDKDGKAQAEPTKVEPNLIEDFKSKQPVALSLSTVLNSPSVFDRIEYVSTYLYLQAFPFPPNGDVVLEKEFWRRFFSLNATRDPNVQKDAAWNDMRRAIEDMRVRITDIKTTVTLCDVSFGSLTRKTSDKFNAGVTATAAVPPALTGITPTLGYASGVDTEATMKLQQQLDQRSTYVDPAGHFLRITQRGMQSVNLAGRFVENITLSIPPAQDSVPVLVPVQENTTKAVKYQIRWLSQPLYSRVDALILSVVVARQPTALAKSTKDSFRLDDPKDAAFIVGVTRPYRITLWQHEREMWDVMTRDIFGNDTVVPKNQKMFFTTFEEEHPIPLTLFGFTPEQQHELLRQIRNLATNHLDQPVSLPLEAGNTNSLIKIGLPDDRNHPTKLVGFKQKIF
jgi:hypothetical protein